MVDVDSVHWVKAMKAELESMDSNQVWDLVEPPINIKPIGCKWVYKRKRKSDGKVETFKTRLVMKGYTQMEGIDYEETFSPVPSPSEYSYPLLHALILRSGRWMSRRHS